MTTQRKLKYSVSDASRRMYKIETNGIYRKLENPLPSESQLRQQRFEERQRPLSQILASSSFRETLDRNAFSRGQSLSNLKKSRQRNSLNLPNSFSLDLEYDVNANAKTDRGEFSSSGNLSKASSSGNSAFAFVPEKDIISLSTRSELSRNSNPVLPSTSTSGLAFPSANREEFHKSRKSSSSSSSSSPSSTSKAYSLRSQSSVKGEDHWDSKNARHKHSESSESENEESKSIRSRKLLEKRPSFKEVFPEKVNEEFLNKNKADPSKRQSSFSRLCSAEQDTNRIFDSDVNIQGTVKNVPYKTKPLLNTSKSSSTDSEDLEDSDYLKPTTQVFDSNEFFRPSSDFAFSGNIKIPETPSSGSEFSTKEGVHHIFDSSVICKVPAVQLRHMCEPAKVADVPPKKSKLSSSPDSISQSSRSGSDQQLYSDSDIEREITLDRTVSIESVPPPLPLSEPPELSGSGSSEHSSTDSDHDSLLELIVNSSKSEDLNENKDFHNPESTDKFDDLVLNSPKLQNVDVKGVVEVPLSTDTVGDLDTSLPKFEEVDDNVTAEIDRFDYLFSNSPKSKDIKVDFSSEIVPSNDNIEPNPNETDVTLTSSFPLDIDSCDDFGVQPPENCDIHANVTSKISFIPEKVYDLKASLPNKKDFEANVDDETPDSHIFDDTDTNSSHSEDNDSQSPLSSEDVESAGVSTPKAGELTLKMATGISPNVEDTIDWPGTTVTYYGPIYASNNTLILPNQSDQTNDDPVKLKDNHSDEDSSSSSSSSSSEHNSIYGSEGHSRSEIDVENLDESEDPEKTTKNQSCGKKQNEKAEVIEVLESSFQSCSETTPRSLETDSHSLETASQPLDIANPLPDVIDLDQSPSTNADVNEALETLDNIILEVSADTPTMESEIKQHQGHLVVVAIDFGTTYSGYAFSFTRDPSHVYMMRKWEGGDPGVVSEKTPTSILLTPDGQFHSFGYSARNNYHDLDPDQARSWMYFDKFKMILHTTPELSKDTLIKATNGKLYPALTVFGLALKYFKDHALQELSDQSGMKIVNEDVRWVISVPAIWRASAKQFMRQAAYEAGLISHESPDQLLISLEPEAASIFCRKLKMYQLVPELNEEKPIRSPKFASEEAMDMNPACETLKEESHASEINKLVKGSRYMVVDCGGGTVDITVHQVDKGEKLIELYRASGGPYGSVGIDIEFEHVLDKIFGKELMEHYRQKCPMGWVDLMVAFESKKRSANPDKSSSLNVSLPFSFIDYYKRHKFGSLEHAIKKFGDKEIQWSRLGMLRLSPEAMRRLFIPTMEKIKQSIGDVLNNRGTRDLQYLFLVGGFSESPILQQEIRREFGSLLKVIIPQGVGLSILKGSVQFGLDPTIVHVRKSRMTYGVGVLNKFKEDQHPAEKRMVAGDTEWCMDVFDKYVLTNQPVALGDVILRSYKPANQNQKKIQLSIYFTENPNTNFVTDAGVQKCGVLTLDLEESSQTKLSRREIQTRMIFGETEIRLSALDVCTGRRVHATIDFLSN